MSNVQKAKDILETMVASDVREGASYSPSLLGSDAVICKKVSEVYRLLCEEIGQSQWREVDKGWLPARDNNTIKCIDVSVDLIAWDGKKKHNGAYYCFNSKTFRCWMGDEINGVTHYMEVDPAPPGKVRIGDGK